MCVCDGTACGGRKRAPGASSGWVQNALYESWTSINRVPGVEETVGFYW